MKRLLCWLATLPLVVAAQGALAFDACNVASDPAHLGQELRDIAAARSPVRYHELARSIRLITTDTGDRLMPGGGEQQNIKFILFPALFVKVTCEIALAMYLNLEGVEPDAFDQAARRAAQCRDAGGTQKTCLAGFADELDRRYSKAFKNSSRRRFAGRVRHIRGDVAPDHDARICPSLLGPFRSYR